MAKKKHRNQQRNERKAIARRANVDVVIRAHDNRLMQQAMKTTFERKAEPQRPSEEDYPYTALAVDEALPLYQKIDPERIFIKIETEIETVIPDQSQPASETNLEVITRWRGMMYAAHPTRGLGVIATGTKLYDSLGEAVRRTCKEFPIVGLKDEEGNVTFPYYDELTGKLMAQAEARRQLRRQKAIDHLNLVIAVGHLTGGL